MKFSSEIGNIIIEANTITCPKSYIQTVQEALLILIMLDLCML